MIPLIRNVYLRKANFITYRTFSSNFLLLIFIISINFTLITIEILIRYLLNPIAYLMEGGIASIFIINLKRYK